MRLVSILAVLAAAVLLSGCATITGTATGAFTGLVDAPAETYRHNSEAFHEHPMLYGLDALVIAPIGAVTGPVFGFVKGISLDLQWVVGQVEYGDAFGSYGPASIWRPHTVQWPVKEDEE
jgi:uncharacterized protein YceK